MASPSMHKCHLGTETVQMNHTSLCVLTWAQARCKTNLPNTRGTTWQPANCTPRRRQLRQMPASRAKKQPTHVHKGDTSPAAKQQAYHVCRHHISNINGTMTVKHMPLQHDYQKGQTNCFCTITTMNTDACCPTTTCPWQLCWSFPSVTYWQC